MNILEFTVGRILPQYRTLNSWIDVYEDILLARGLSEKTIMNAKSGLRRQRKLFGNMRIGSIKPLEILKPLKGEGISQGASNKNVLQLKAILNEAINYSWIDRNPLQHLKLPKTRVLRKRLSSEDFLKILEWSKQNQQEWCHRVFRLALVTGQRRADIAKFRFDDVWDNHLHIIQQKTETRLELPLELRLDLLDTTIGQEIDYCRNYYRHGDFLIRKHNGKSPCLASLSACFEEARNHIMEPGEGLPPSLHECRSLSERLYRKQGINTMVLLGHKHQSMTDAYNDDRGLTKSNFKRLVL